MDDEQPKHLSKPVTQMDHVHSDFALARLLQEQQRALTMLTTLGSESSGYNGEDGGGSDGNGSGSRDDFDFDFFASQDTNEPEFLGAEDSNSDQEMDGDDDIDPDQLSYEELIALGEIVGEEGRGLPPNEVPSYLRPTSKDCTKSDIDRCVICQVEYQEGEGLVALSCQHPYHPNCISKWLQIKKICPICSTEVSSMPHR